MDTKKVFATVTIGIGTILTGIKLYSKFGNKEIEKYSSKWFVAASDSLLNDEREKVRQAYCSAGSDFSLACRLEKLLGLFDKVLSKRAWDGKEYSYPKHGSHGWYLPSDD